MKRSILIFTSFLVLGALAAFSPAAFARHSMRSERIQACSDKSAGDPCSYTKKGESVNGTCESARHGKLICTASSSGTSGGEMTSPSSGAAAGSESGTMGAPSGAGGTMGSPSGAGGTGGTPPNP